MNVKKFNKQEAELIAETTEGTFDAVRIITRQFFAHYVSEHTNGEDEILAVTEFYEHLQTVLSDMHKPTVEEVMSESAKHVDELEKESK